MKHRATDVIQPTPEDMYNGRKMTEFEQKMRMSQRCIGCGQKVLVTPHYKKIDGKSVLVKKTWPFECQDCRRTRTNRPGVGPDFGAARASVQHEFIRRIGGSFKDGN